MSTYEFSPQGYNYDIDPKGVHPFWETEEEGEDVNITATALVDDNTGVPAVVVHKTQTGDNINFEFDFRNLKGPAGSPGQDGQDGADGVTPNINMNASVDSNTGTPSVEVNRTGTKESPNFALAFHNLKGAEGSPGQDGVTPQFTASANTYDDGGTPYVNLTQGGTPAHPELQFDFYNLGNGGGGGGATYPENYQYYNYINSISDLDTLLSHIQLNETVDFFCTGGSIEGSSALTQAGITKDIALNPSGGFTITAPGTTEALSFLLTMLNGFNHVYISHVELGPGREGYNISFTPRNYVGEIQSPAAFPGTTVLPLNDMVVAISYEPGVSLNAEVRATQASGSGEVVVATADDTASAGGAYHILTVPSYFQVDLDLNAITIQMLLMSKEDYTQS